MIEDVISKDNEEVKQLNKDNEFLKALEEGKVKPPVPFKLKLTGPISPKQLRAHRVG